MNRLLSGAVLSAFLVAGLLPNAAAGVPDPSLSTIPNLIVAPGGGSTYCLTIVGLAGPISGATVELRYDPAVDAAVCWCPSQVRPVPAAVTNASGVACFNIAGGECIDPSAFGAGIDVYVNDILLKTIGQRSPDVVTSPAGPCSVGLTDAVDFTGPLASATYGFCYDLVEDGVVGLSDAVTFTPYAASATSCP